MDMKDLVKRFEPPKLPELNIRIPPSAEQTQELISRTGDVHAGVETLTQSSVKLEKLTEALIDETTNVHREIAWLANSSGKLETLTATLKNLTWALIFLTVAAIVVSLGIEIWKSYHAELPSINIAPPPPRSSPQTPSPPPR
jgi:hypothetical protein